MAYTPDKAKNSFMQAEVKHGILIVTGLLTVIYFYLIAVAFPIGDMTLFTLLIIGEVFHVFQIGMYLHTVVNRKAEDRIFDTSYHPTVDVFVTVAGEPTDIVEETLLACKAMNYPADRFKIHILNDGYVAKKENWEEMEILAQKLGIYCITRKVPGGAKAGNINNAMRETDGEHVVIFDADHVPHPDFLMKTIPYLADPRVAFVQTPQYYKNFRMNYITRSSWEQQQLFFGPICKGKDGLNCATMCGTNMVIRRDAILEVGGMSEVSIAEDFLTGMLLHSNGWKSVYVPEVLAEGLAPEDFLSYFKQQFRWARGAMDVIFGQNLLFRRGISFTHRMQYLSSVSFYFSGLIVLIDALIPLAYFYFGLVPLTISTMTLALVFVPYLFLTLYILEKSSNFSFTFRALIFSMGGFNIHLKAIWAAITRQKSAFHVTPKKQQQGNFIGLVIPQIAYVLLAFVGMALAFAREGFSASFMTNSAWALLNVAIFVPFIYAALPASAVTETEHEDDLLAEEETGDERLSPLTQLS